MGDLHKILQVRPGADDETIAAAYARLRRRYDPAFGGPFADEAALREVEKAYALLSDPQTRDAYELSHLRDDGTAPGGVSPATTSTEQSTTARDPFGLQERKPTSTTPDSPPEVPTASVVVPSEAVVGDDHRSDIWRNQPAAESQSAPPPGRERDDTPTVAYSAPTLPNRQKVSDKGSEPIWSTSRWRRIGVVPLAAVAFVVIGAGLAGWGIVQAVGSADDDVDDEPPGSAEAQEDTAAEQPAEASETLAAPEVASLEALPSELASFADDVIAEFEDGSYRVYDFVAIVTENGSVFYAAVAIEEDSELIGQRVFFFVDESFIGSDWEEPVRSIESIASVAGGQIRVVYRVYREDDEDCCPSGEPFPVVFTYDDDFRSDSPSPPAGIFAD